MWPKMCPLFCRALRARLEIENDLDCFRCCWVVTALLRVRPCPLRQVLRVGRVAQRLDVGESSRILLPFKGNGVGADDSLGVYPPFQSSGLRVINFKGYTVCGITVL